MIYVIWVELHWYIYIWYMMYATQYIICSIWYMGRAHCAMCGRIDAPEGMFVVTCYSGASVPLCAWQVFLDSVCPNVPLCPASTRSHDWTS